MPQQAATIESLSMAFEFVKEMRDDGLELGEGYRAASTSQTPGSL
jgi:hypothetical protein